MYRSLWQRFWLRSIVKNHETHIEKYYFYLISVAHNYLFQFCSWPCSTKLQRIDNSNDQNYKIISHKLKIHQYWLSWCIILPFFHIFVHNSMQLFVWIFQICPHQFTILCTQPKASSSVHISGPFQDLTGTLPAGSMHPILLGGLAVHHCLLLISGYFADIIMKTANYKTPNVAPSVWLEMEKNAPDIKYCQSTVMFINGIVFSPLSPKL